MLFRPHRFPTFMIRGRHQPEDFSRHQGIMQDDIGQPKRAHSSYRQQVRITGSSADEIDFRFPLLK